MYPNSLQCQVEFVETATSSRRGSPDRPFPAIRSILVETALK
jgi:hypothetical protein